MSRAQISAVSAEEALAAAPSMSPEEQHALQQKMAALDKLLADQQKAKYKIEIFFRHKRKLRGPSVGAISIWESGTKFHGGGDSKIYLCPGRSLGRSDCEHVIPDYANKLGFLLCPNCKQVWQGQDVIGEEIGNWTPKTWAEKILLYFQKLDHNADIYLKYPLYDVRVAAGLEQERQLHGDRLRLVRAQRQQYMYPLKNIVIDTRNGADLLGRFYAFLTA